MSVDLLPSAICFLFTVVFCTIFGLTTAGISARVTLTFTGNVTCIGAALAVGPTEQVIGNVSVSTGLCTGGLAVYKRTTAVRGSGRS
jgi:hypothetical protein